MVQTREMTVDELAVARDEGPRLLDVRSPEEFVQEHVPGAVNVPLEDVLAAPGRFAGESAYVICGSGTRSWRAAEAMNAEGAAAVSVAGGTSAWTESGRDVERGDVEGGAQR